MSSDMDDQEMEQRTARIKKKLEDFVVLSIKSNTDTGSASSVNEHVPKMAPEITTELYIAARNDNLKRFEMVFESFLKDQTSPGNPSNHAKILDNTLLLHVATEYGSARIASFIAQRFPYLMAQKNSDGDTPFHIAARDGYKSVFNALIKIYTEHIKFKSGCSDGILRVQNKNMNTALHEALIHRRKSMAKHLAKLCRNHEDFLLNNEDKSTVYLAVEAGYTKCVKVLLANAAKDDVRLQEKDINGESVVHAAAKGKNSEILEMVTSKLPSLMNLDDNMRTTPLHCAASAGHIKGVRHLLTSSIDFIIQDADELFPIHHASMNGHVDVVQELLKHIHDPSQHLNKKGQNILHLAAESGRCNVVNYILKHLGSKQFVNQRDDDGNTALHLASLKWHPHIVSALTWDKRVNVKLLNNKRQTALDVALQKKERHITLRQSLTCTALIAAKKPRNVIVDTTSSNSNQPENIVEKTSSNSNQPENTERFKDRVNSLLVVATLVATVSFAAGFTMPGGYNSSEPDVGMAVMLKNIMFQIFVFCNSTAMYIATLVVVILMWAQLGDLQIAIVSLDWAVPLLGVALTMMCVAYFNGVYIVVSKVNWLTYAVLISGCVFPVTIAGLFFSLGLPLESGNRAIRFINYYLIRLLLWITNSYSESEEGPAAPEKAMLRRTAKKLQKKKEMQDKVAQLLAERCGDIDDPGATEDPLPISDQIEIIEEVVSKQSNKRKGTYISGLGAAMKRPPLPRGRGNNAEIKQELMAVKEQNEMQEARIKHLEEMILKLAPPAPATGNPSDGASLS